MTTEDQPGEDVVEPENSTVQDWFGQNVARDQEVADQALSEADGDTTQAEQIYEERAEGEATYDAGHPRPDKS